MNDFLARDESIWHPFTPHTDADKNLFITKGEGAYLHTHDDRKIIDAISSWWVNLHGHANPVIAQAIYQQALQLEHVIFAGFTHTPALELTEKLLTILPASVSKVFFSDNGSTANEVAMKMAIQYWHNRGIKKKSIVAFRGAYHGDTFGSMSAGDRSVFSEPFSDYLFDVLFLDFPNGQNDAEVIRVFETHVRTGEVGAFIFEPLVQGAAGMRMYRADTLNTLLGIARQHEVVCIADEVFTGFFRTGKCFATDYLSEKPDIIAISKGITGGTLPLGVTACSEKIYSAFHSDQLTRAFLHGHSYTANPLACAAALASFDLLFETNCQERIRRISGQQADFVRTIGGHPKLLKATSLGTILSLEIDAGKGGYTNSIRTLVYNYFLSRDILLRPLGNVIYMVPPYVISDEDLQRVHSTILEFIDSL